MQHLPQLGMLMFFNLMSAYIIFTKLLNFSERVKHFVISIEVPACELASAQILVELFQIALSEYKMVIAIYPAACL